MGRGKHQGVGKRGPGAPQALNPHSEPSRLEAVGVGGHEDSVMADQLAFGAREGV